MNRLPTAAELDAVDRHCNRIRTLRYVSLQTDAKPRKPRLWLMGTAIALLLVYFVVSVVIPIAGRMR